MSSASVRQRVGSFLEQRGEGLVVSQTADRSHHRRVAARFQQHARARDDHLRCEAQAIDVRLQRAQHVRQRERQHGNDARGEIHAGAALARAGVERRATAHVVAHVGDGDDEPETLGVRLAVDRVVEVLGVFAVDGDQRQVAQVHAPRRFRGVDFVAIGFRLADGLGREFTRQIEARDGGFAGELDRLLRIQTLDDARLGSRARSGVTRHRRDDPVAVARAGEFFRRHHATHADAPIRRRHERRAAMDFERSDECLGGVFEDSFEPARIAAIAARSTDTRTRSPCMTPAICGGGRNTASSWPSMRTKPNPARLALTMPSATRPCPWLAGAPAPCGRRPPALCAWRGFSWLPRDFPFLRFK